MFLLALRVSMPFFWETLWKARTPEAVIWWTGQWNVVDEWLLAVVSDTLEYWESDPGSPDAALNPAYKWFLYRPLIQQDQKPFQLVLENPRPIRGELQFPTREVSQLLPANFVQHPSAGETTPAQRALQNGLAAALTIQQVESVAEFKIRVLRTCEEQLREYEKDFHRALTFDRDPETAKHAAWTAARFCGAGYMHIAERWPGLLRGLSKDPEQPDKTVNMAVRRFAERIGLTLAKR
jgi:hypothetical protein